VRLACVAIALAACATTPAPQPPAPETAAAPAEPAAAPRAAESEQAEQTATDAPSATLASAEAALIETLDMMNDMTAVLETVVDEATARTALPRMQALVDKANRLKPRVEALKKTVPPEEIASLKQKYEARMMRAIDKLMQETKRVGSIPGAGDVMRTMPPQ
jgi:hypothetical protein